MCHASAPVTRRRARRRRARSRGTRARRRTCTSTRSRPGLAEHQVGVAGRTERVDRVLLVVRVQVADDQLVAGGPWPVGSLSSHSASAIGRLRARDVAVARPSPVSGSPTALQSEPFDFRWLTTTVTSPPAWMSVKVCASAGRLIGVEVGVDRRVEHRVGTRGHLGRLVDERRRDDVGAELRRGDEVVVPAPTLSLRASTSVATAGVAVVLDLDEADDVGVDLGDRRDDLRLLAVELRLVVRAAPRTRLEGREVVQHVEARDLRRAADLGHRGAARFTAV